MSRVLLVCGRADKTWLFEVLDHRHNQQTTTKVVVGNYTDTDGWIIEWGNTRGVPLDIYQANWDIELEAARLAERDLRMFQLGVPEYVLCFAEGEEDPLPNAVDMARTRNIPVAIARRDLQA